MARQDTFQCLLFGISDSLLNKLQTALIVAAHVVTGARKFDHISLLCVLQWLLICQHIKLEDADDRYKCLCGLIDECLL